MDIGVGATNRLTTHELSEELVDQLRIHPTVHDEDDDLAGHFVSKKLDEPVKSAGEGINGHLMETSRRTAVSCQIQHRH